MSLLGRFNKKGGCHLIELQWHKVTGDIFHTLLRITPNDQAYWSRGEFFKKHTKIDSSGKLYFTLGAGPEYDELDFLLVSNVNRNSDSEPHLGKYKQISVPKKYNSETDFIEQLIVNDAKYTDHLDYDIFPAKVGNQTWYIADDGYNSNSYVAGLLISAGVVPAPVPPVSTPGFQKPVPIRYFK